MMSVIDAGGAYLHTAAGTIAEVPDTGQGAAAGTVLDVIVAVCIIAGRARSLTGLTYL